MKQLLTTKETCDFLKISRLTLYRMLKAKKIAGCKVGRSWRFEKSVLEQWIESKMQENSKAVNTANHKEIKRDDVKG